MRERFSGQSAGRPQAARCGAGDHRGRGRGRGFAGALLEYLVDPGIGSFGDALWWAVSTVTTTGFGDVVPTNAAGRVVGVMLMMVGISLIPTITSLVVAVFIAQRSGRRRSRTGCTETRSLARLDELEARLALDQRARPASRATRASRSRTRARSRGSSRARPPCRRCSNASGIIVSASMVRIAPAANALTNPIARGDAPSSNA